MSRQSPFDPFTFDDDPAQQHAGGSGGGGRESSKPHSTAGSSKRSNAEIAPEEKGSKPLPPRLNVRLKLHEEVSSTAVIDPDGEAGSLSQLSIEGKVTARVESSNAKQNAPFRLLIAGPMATLANITCGDYCSLEEEEEANVNTPFYRGGKIGTVPCRVEIPKSEVAGCDILSYSMNVRTQNMPILVQTKVIIDGRAKIRVQIRSNLSNCGDLTDLMIVVAIPPTLRGDTVRVTRGDRGVWDATKRTVTWRMGNLPHGESRLVSADADVHASVAGVMHDNPFDAKVAERKVRCPVLVRCRSGNDQVSDLQLNATTLDGVPATIAQQYTKSYQLLHRVGKMGA
ncbi:hypothetical protein ACHAWF_002619 [Thalassiosira exigua]